VTALESIRRLVELSKTRERRVIAIDFVPSPEGIALMFHFAP
jgi:hypothetical protein